MHILRTKDKTKPSGGQWKFSQPSNTTVCYEEPINAAAFPQLSSIPIVSNPEIFYRVSSNGGLIEELYPACAFVSRTFMDVSNRLQSSTICHSRIESAIKKIRDEYAENRTFYGNGSPKLHFGSELHELRADYAALLYLVRSSLDQVASCINELLGNGRAPIRSFSDLLKLSKKEDCNLPAELVSSLHRHQDWFSKMRDVRDYLTHLGFVRITIWQTTDENVELCIHNRIDLGGSADYFYRSFLSLLQSLDTVLADHIRRGGVEK